MHKAVTVYNVDEIKDFDLVPVLYTIFIINHRILHAIPMHMFIVNVLSMSTSSASPVQCKKGFTIIG